MQLILDNLAALFIVGILILSIISLQIRSQQSATEGVVHSMATEQAATMVEMVRTDVDNMIDPDASAASPFDCEIQKTGSGFTDLFRLPVLSPDVGPVEVTYRLEDVTDSGGQADSVKVNGVLQPLFRLTRVVRDAAGNVVSTGESKPVVANYEVTLLAEDDTPVTDCSSLYKVRVEVLTALDGVEKVERDQRSVSNLNAARMGVTVQPASFSSTSY